MNQGYDKNKSFPRTVNIGEGTNLNDLASETISGMLRIRLAQQVLSYAATLPQPVELYPNFIIENELTILFADTGIGKTVLATQMGIHIATERIVLYVDLELTDRQFLKRYRGPDGLLFSFPNKFFRADFTPRFRSPDRLSYLDYFIRSLEQAIEEIGATVVIIDNLTKLAAGDTDSAKTAIPVLEHLSRLKFDRGLTIIVLEHNKKVDPKHPISLNDLQGSKMKPNFADAVFSIGRSRTDKDLRYLKQLKVRSAEMVFDTENVATYEVTTEGGYLHFEPIGHGSEYEYLHQPDEGEQGPDKLTEQYERIQELKGANLKGDALAREMGMSRSKVTKIEQKYKKKNGVSSAIFNQLPLETLPETH